MKPKIYLETTIPSYLVSTPSRDLVVAAHQQVTRDWWQNRKGDFDIYVSQFVVDEAGAGDVQLAQARLDVIKGFAQLDITDDVSLLANGLITGGVIPRKAVIDAAHIAVAAVHGLDFLMTWNCAHIANAAIANALTRICREYGFRCPVICTPEELMGE